MLRDDEEERTRLTPFRRSAIRPIQYMGCDRELFILVTAGILTVVMNALDLRTTLIGGIMWLFAVFCLRSMTKSDPHLRNKYQRSIRYQKYYPPHSTPFCKNKRDGQGRY